MQPLKNESPPDDKLLFVFGDFYTTQDTRFSDTATQHVPNLVCVQQFCSKCETVDDVKEDCIRCVKRKQSFWEDPIGNLRPYLCEPRLWCNKVIAIAHNAKAFDLHFILNRTVILNWQPQLIMNGLKIVCRKVENLTFTDSVSFMPLPLRKLLEAFGLKATKSWYPHLLNTMQTIDYVSIIPDIGIYSSSMTSDSERT
jgi:hypothetical protein